MSNNLLFVWYWNDTLKIVCLVLACVSLAVVTAYLIYMIAKNRKARYAVEQEKPVYALAVIPSVPVASFPEEQRAVAEGEVLYLYGAVAEAYEEPFVPPFVAEPTEEEPVAPPAVVPDAGFEGKRKTLQDRLDSSDDETRGYFEEIKAFLAQYPAVNRIESKLYLTYVYKKRPVVKMTVHGKAALLYYPFDANAEENSKYHFEDKSAVKAFANFPAEFKLKSDRGLKYAKELILLAMEKAGVPEDAKIEIVPAEEVALTVAEEPVITAAPEEEIAVAEIVSEEATAPAEELVLAEDGAETLVAAAAAAEVLPAIVVGDGVFEGKRKTLQDRLDSSDDETRGYFEEIKAFLAQYPAVNCITSKLYLTYVYKKRPVVKMTVHGKAALLYYPFDANAEENSKYHFEDKSAVKAFANFPAEFKLKSDRGLKYAKELILYAMEYAGVPDVVAGRGE